MGRKNRQRKPEPFKCCETCANMQPIGEGDHICDACYKNFAYVAGEGEGSARVIVEVDLRSSADEERREVYVDARDLQSTYQDDAGDEHTYTADQYRALLRQRGLEKLAEYQKIETVNGDVDPNANLTYGVDFDLGDLCTYRYQRHQGLHQWRPGHAGD